MPATSRRCWSAHVTPTSRCTISLSGRASQATPTPTATTTPTALMATSRPDSVAVDLPEPIWSEALATLREARSATLVCHVAPDGDALGSMLALARVLRARGCDVTCTWGDSTWVVPASYGWLPDIACVVAPEEVPPRPELMVVLATASRARLG